MDNCLIDQIVAQNVNSLAIIGMAKNAGKTVTFNTIVKEATAKGIKLGLVSYGRDGEDIDAITRQEKPRICVPPYTVFASARKALEKSALEAEIVHETGFNTLLGEVYVYRTGKEGGQVELVGVNSGTQLKKIKHLFEETIDLMLIDGAFDRRSSAVPSLADGLILATGAVVGNTENLVIQKTLQSIDKLTLPVVRQSALREKCQEILSKGKNGIIHNDGNYTLLSSNIVFAAGREITEANLKGIEALVFNGALIDSFAEELVLSLGAKDCKLIVRDGTKVFLQKRNLNLLKKSRLELQVLDAVKLIGVTVNPISPYGITLDANIIVTELRDKLSKKVKGVSVYDLLGEAYLSIGE